MKHSQVNHSADTKKREVDLAWVSLSRVQVWVGQLSAIFLTISIYCGYYFWNYNIRSPELRICNAEPFSEELRNYFLPIVGAAISNTITQLLRIFLTYFGWSKENHGSHPMARLMNLTISSIITIGNVCTYFDVAGASCVDFFGVRTSPFLWLEWLCGVPFMFFLVTGLDVKKTTMSASDISCQLLAAVSLLSLFLANERLPTGVIYVLFLVANIAMPVACFQLLHSAFKEHKAASEVMKQMPKHDWDNFEYKDLNDQLVVAQWKLNTAIFICAIFFAFPILYYALIMGLVSFNVFTISIHAFAFLAKTLQYNILCDAHAQIIDVHMMLRFEEKKKSREARHAFLRYVFHELRVPLNSITMGTQLLSGGQQWEEDEQETLDMMHGASTFMSETLNDVLSMQKIEEGNMQLEESFFPPEAIVKSMLSNLRSQYETKKLTLYVSVMEGVPLQIRGDQSRLEHVLGNLLSNAIKFSDENARIWLSVYKSGSFIYFSVKDEGPGMSETERLSLFSPFVQIRPGEMQKGCGTGLGLSICKSIVNLSNGVIGCRSTQREGSDVTTGGSEFYFGIKHVAEKLATSPRARLLSVDLSLSLAALTSTIEKIVVRPADSMEVECSQVPSVVVPSIATTADTHTAETYTVATEERVSTAKATLNTATEGVGAAKNATTPTGTITDATPSEEEECDATNLPTRTSSFYTAATEVKLFSSDSACVSIPIEEVVAASDVAATAGTADPIAADKEAAATNASSPVASHHPTAPKLTPAAISAVTKLNASFDPVSSTEEGNISTLTTRTLSFHSTATEESDPAAHTASTFTTSPSTTAIDRESAIATLAASPITVDGGSALYDATAAACSTEEIASTIDPATTTSKDGRVSVTDSSTSVSHPTSADGAESAEEAIISTTSATAAASVEADPSTSVEATASTSNSTYAVLSSFQTPRTSSTQSYSFCIDPLQRKGKATIARQHSLHRSLAATAQDSSFHQLKRDASKFQSRVACHAYSAAQIVQGTKALVDCDLRIRTNSGASTPSRCATPRSATAVTVLGRGSLSTKEEAVAEEDSDSVSATAIIKHVLVVDDVLSNRKMLQKTLLRRQVVCDLCANGREAVDRVGSMGNDYYQLIFMDNIMPVMDGENAATLLRSNGYCNLLIAVTGNILDADVARFEQAGADLVLAKPLQSEKLDSLIFYCSKFGTRSPSSAEGGTRTLKEIVNYGPLTLSGNEY